MTKDMTSGSPMKHVLSFTIPLIFGNLFQQFYSMVDTIIVGRLLGTGPLAAVGSTGSINFFIIGFCLGICSGFSIPVAQRFGSKDFSDLKRFVGNIIWLSAAFSVLMTLLTVALCRPILEWMSTPADIINDAYSYIVVIFWGIPFIVFYMSWPGCCGQWGTAVRRCFFWWPLRCSTSAWIFCWCW
ncbi:MAG: MATE family efflux transporter [Eubacteriales bacterium]